MSQKKALGQVIEVLRTIWQLLHPLHGRYRQFTWLVILYEGMQIGLSYAASGMILFYEYGLSWQAWVALIGVYVLYEELFLRLDNRVEWMIIMKLDNAAYRYLREQILTKFFELDPAWHEDRSSGQLVGKVNDGIEKLREIISMTGWEFIPTVIQVILSILPLLYFSPWAAGLTILGFAGFTWVTLIGHATRQPLRKKRHDLYEQSYQLFDEFAESHRTVVTMNQSERLLDEYTKVLDSAIELNEEETRMTLYRYNRIRFRIVSYAKYLIYGIWAWQFQTGAITIPTFVFLNILLEKLIHSCWRMSRLFMRTMEAGEAARRLANLMKEQPSLTSGNFDPPLPESVTIELENVWFDYQKDSCHTIRGISVKLEPGTVTAIVGPSGAGKSTLQRLMMRERDPQSGSISVNGISAPNWSLNKYRQVFSEVPQGDRVYIYNRTVKENIAFGKPDATEEEIIWAAKLAGIHDFVVSLPKAYHTRVGDRGLRLSGGQKQRIALARAFLVDAPVLVLDEATSSVDAKTERVILEALERISKGKTVVVVAHRLSTVKDANRIVVIDQGQVIEDGTHHELVGNNGHYTEQVQLQSAAWT